MQNKIPIADVPVIIYPELVAAVLTKNESELYAIWSILKGIDKYRAKSLCGSGKFSFQSIFSMIQQILDVGDSRAYDLIRKGENTYWQAFGKSQDGTKVTCLIGLEQLIKRVKPTCTRSEPFQFVVKDIESNVKEIKTLMIAIVAARYVDERPNAIDSIAQLTGQSVRTVQRALRDCVDLNIEPQYDYISTHSTEYLAKQKINKLKINAAMYSIVEEGNKFSVYRQMPNRYVLTQPKRLPLRKRPKVLRQRDSMNCANIQPKKYFPSHSKKPIEHEHLKNHGTTLMPSGLVGVWSTHNIKKQKTLSFKSIAGKWFDIKRKYAKQKMVK